MVHTFNPSTWEAEAGGSVWVQGQVGQPNVILSQIFKWGARDPAQWKRIAHSYVQGPMFNPQYEEGKETSLGEEVTLK